MFCDRGAAARTEGGRPTYGAMAANPLADGPVVHIIDFDADSRARLSDLLAENGLRVLVHGGLDSFLDIGRGEGPGCLILDAGLTSLGGDLRDVLRAGQLDCPMVMTGLRADVATAVQAMKSGAVDFVEKPYGAAAILAAVQAALDLDRAQRLTTSRQAALRTRYATLTPRERQVMALVTAGKMNKQVAGDLGLSQITVKAHRGVMMRKMGARSFAELVRMADALGDDAKVGAGPHALPTPLRNGC